MRTISRFLFVAGALLLPLVSCQKEAPQKESSSEQKEQTEEATLTFTASVDQTKTDFNGGKLLWEAEDKMVISDGSSIMHVKLQAENIIDDGLTAVFEISGLYASASEYYAIFPDTDDYHSANDVFDGTNFVFHNSGLTQNNNISFFSAAKSGKATNGNVKLYFVNTAALLHFDVTDANNEIASVTMKTKTAGEYLATDFLYKYGDSSPFVAGSSPRDSVCFELNGNKSVNIAVEPGTYHDFTITCYRSDKTKVGTATVSGTIEFKLGEYRSIPNFPM